MKRLLAVVCLAMASHYAMAELPLFEGLDADGDGMLSVLEAKGVDEVDFFDADTNKNGSIDAEGYRIAVEPSDE